jgi:hypothetical protein
MDYSLFVCLLALSGTLVAEVVPYFVVWVLISILGFFVMPVMCFGLGGLLYVLGELTTLNGVELIPFGGNRVHVLKGAHRKGEFIEYFFVALVVIAALVLPKDEKGGDEDGRNFEPYMYNWEEMYEDGLVDPREWKEHRFDYF